MSTAADASPPPPPPSGSSSSSPSSQEEGKAASRNKRKYRADPPSGEPGPFFGLERPATAAGYVGPESMSPEEAAAAAAGEGVDLDTCDACSGFHGSLAAAEAEEEEEGEPPVPDSQQGRVRWSDLNEARLEKVLLESLDATFDNAAGAVAAATGCSEAAARAAVVRAARRHGWKEGLAGLGEAAVGVLRAAEGDMWPREGASVEDVRETGRAVLGSLVAVVGEARTFYSTGDVMFCLLMSDMDVARACTMDYTHAPVPAAAAAAAPRTQVIAQPFVGNYGPGVSSDVSVSIANPQAGVIIRGKLTPVAPNSFDPPSVRADSSTVPACPNLSSCEPSVSGNMQPVITNTMPKEHTVAAPDHLEGQPFVAAATHSSKDENPFTSKRGSSKRDSSHRQKFMSIDKSSRAMGSKGPLRSVKHSSLGSAALDRKCRQVSESSTNSLKGSSKVGKGFSAVMTEAEVSIDNSFAAPTPSLETNRTASSNPLPATSTDLSLSLSSSNDIAVQSPDQDRNIEATDSSSKINFSYDEDQKAWIPHDRKDKIVLILVERQKEMQAHMQDWTDWAQEKVMLVARRLAKEKEELQSLRKEKQESDRLQEERHTLEVSTRKKLLEMDSAISRANIQLVKADASARRRDAENAQLRIQLEAAKRHAVESATKFEELSRKDEKTLKRSQHWESERAVLQDELAAEKSKLSRVLQQLQHAKEKKDQLQARSKQEEAEKIEAIARVTSEKKERDQIEMSLRSEENLLHLKAENDMQRYKSEVRALEQQISQLKMSLDSANVAAPKWGTGNKSYALRLSEGRKGSNAPILAQQDFSFDDIQRDRECVMCLSEEMSVVFLPCAHQVVCGKCNDLHEKQGMKDCPSCRTPIQRRVCARSADS